MDVYLYSASFRFFQIEFSAILSFVFPCASRTRHWGQVTPTRFNFVLRQSVNLLLYLPQVDKHT